MTRQLEQAAFPGPVFSRRPRVVGLLLALAICQWHVPPGAGADDYGGGAQPAVRVSNSSPAAPVNQSARPGTGTADAAVQPAIATGGQQPRPVLKGRVTYLVPRGTPMKLKLSSVPTTGLRLGDRDLDGNLYPAQLGQEITAKTSEDLYVDDHKVIPQGTVFHGRVTQIHPPRRAGRPGWLSLTFDTLERPDGRRFAFHMEADNFRKSTAGSKAKGFGIIAAHTAGGAICGALIAYELFGMQNTIAMHGYNVAGGAAAGAIAGTAYALLRRGPNAVLEPGDDLNMEIDTDLLLPAATEPTVKKPEPKLDGLEVEIVKSKLKKDGLGGHYLQLDTIITNETEHRFSSLDVYLEDDNGQRFAICPSLDEDSEVNFQVERNSIKRIKFAFQVEYPKLRRKLVWLDHRSQTPVLTMRLP